MSMAAGEYVSVQFAGRHRSRRTWRASAANSSRDGPAELEELTAIYVGRGLDPALARQVAVQLMAHDAIGAHARDELGISDALTRASDAGGLGVGGQFRRRSRPAAPGGGTGAAGDSCRRVSGTSLVFLALLGGVAARAGGARVTVGALRVTFWGALAMAFTAGVGALFGTVV